MKLLSSCPLSLSHPHVRASLEPSSHVQEDTGLHNKDQLRTQLWWMYTIDVSHLLIL